MDIKVDKSNWEKVRLGDVATEYSKRVNNPSESGLERFVGNSNIGQWDFRVKNWDSTSSVTSAMKLFEPNDYLLVRRSLYASDFRERAPRAHFAGVCSGDILTIRENPDHIADGFLITVLNSPALWRFVVANASGSITRRIKWKDLANYEFLLPPKKEQIEISNLLWSVEEVTEANKKLLLKAEILHQVQQKKLFDAQGFESRGIMDIADVKRGRFTPRPRNDPKYFGGDIPFIQTSEVIEAKDYIHRYARTLNSEGLLVSKLFPKETIVMVIAGTYVGSCGMLAFDSAFTDSLVGIHANPNELRQKYLFYYMQFKEKNIDALATEVAQRNLSIELFQNFKVSFPSSLELQDEIVEQIEASQSNLKRISSSINCSKELKMSLITEVF